MTKRRVMNKIDMLQSAKLIALIEQEFAEKKMTDKDFAAYASGVLGFPIAENNVETRRVALNIPATRPQRTKHNTESLLELIRGLEQRIDALEKAAAWKKL